jgi:RNA polymerase sigma-70 factor, ECF subfamily
MLREQVGPWPLGVTSMTQRRHGLCRKPRAREDWRAVFRIGWLTNGGWVESRVEQELVRKCQSGGSRFFEPLVRAYEGEAIRIARAMLGDVDGARDATQEAFVKAYKAIDTFDATRSFRPWFLQILRNQCRDALRSRKARRKFEVPETRTEVRAQAKSLTFDTEREHARSEASTLLHRGLSVLDEGTREIIIMKELEDLSYQEIAVVLQIPEGTVASRLYYARRALREALEAMGVRYP